MEGDSSDEYNKKSNFLFAKAVTLYGFCFSVPLIFYSYKVILGENYLFFVYYLKKYAAYMVNIEGGV